MSSNDSVKRDIFISYSSKNFDEALTIRDELINNGFSCWMAPDDIRPGENYAEEIMLGLKSATMVVLVYSRGAQDSIYVTNEIKTAFDMEKPIIAYKIDETLPEGKMAFYLKNKQWIDASVESDYKDLFDELVENTRRLCVAPKPKKNFDLKIPIIAVALVILIAVAGVMLLGGSQEVETDSADSSNITIDLIEFVDDTDNGYSWKYSYTVIGTIPSELSNSSKDVVHVDFYDDSGKVVQSDDTKIGDVEGNILGSAFVDKNNIEKVSVELRDSKGKVVSSAESSEIGNNTM